MSTKHNNVPPPPPRGMIGPRVNVISRKIRQIFNEVINQEGIFSGQHHIIILLTHHEGLTISQIANHLGVTNATASVSTKRMEKAGLIIRKPDEKDARITRLYLSDKGRALDNKIHEKIDSQESIITDGMTEEEIMLLSDLLDKAIYNITKEDESNV